MHTQKTQDNGNIANKVTPR